jgi:hypothetical protein
LLALFISAKVCFQLHRNNFAVFFVGVNSCHVFLSFAEDVKSSFSVDLSVDLIAQ